MSQISGYRGLFIPGPTNVPDRIRQVLNVPMQDMRAQDFGDLTLPLLSDLKKVFRTKTAETFMFTSSGTGGWEACLANLFSADDKVLISSFGQFSMLWADMCVRFGLDVIHCSVEWGLGVPLEDYQRILSEDKAHSIKAVFACHNETSTGVTSNISAIRQILDDLQHPALLCVDGISSIGSIDFKMDEWGVDVAVAGSQKGFMLPAGLALIAVSQKALSSRTTASLPNTYFSFDDHLKANATGHFPTTPATQLFHGLRASIDMILEEGLEAIHTRHHLLASGVRMAVKAWGLEMCAKEPELWSDTVTAIMVPNDHDSRQLLDIAYHNYGLSFGAGLSQLSGKVLRIGHLGYLNEIMVLQAVSGCEMVFKQAGLSIELGSGVAATQKHFIECRTKISEEAA